MPKYNQQVSDTPALNESAEPIGAAGTLRVSAAEPQSPLGAGGNPQGAPSSNTAPSNPINPPPIHILRFGVDSLYLSYRGELKPEMSALLRKRKELAQSNNPAQVVYAQIEVAGHVFTVADRGRKGFAYNLSDNWFRVDVASGLSSSDTRPFVYAQVSSELLTRIGPLEAEDALRGVADGLGDVFSETANVSRADLCVDFTTEYPLDVITDADWISRVRYLGRHVVKRQFSGWSFGRGGNVVARLYNKTLEMEEHPRDYLEEEWELAGWSKGQTVWRLEFQFRRPAMTELGVSDFEQLMDHLGSLWAYGAESWLRLADFEQSTQQRERPTHPLWLVLAAVNWGTTREYSRTTPPKDRLPPDHWVYRLSEFTSFMARESLFDPVTAWDAYWESARNYHERRAHFTGIDFKGYLIERAMHKARLFNTIMNQPAANDDDFDDDPPNESPAARAYRKARDGE